MEVPEAQCRSSRGLLEVQGERDAWVDRDVEVVRRLDQRSSTVARHPLMRSLWQCWLIGDVDGQCCRPKEAHPDRSGGWMKVGQGKNRPVDRDLRRSGHAWYHGLVRE